MISQIRRMKQFSTRKWLLWAVFVRIVLIAFSIVVDVVLPNHQPHGVETLEELYTYNYQHRILTILTSPFLRWDAIHYLKIALNGYHHDYQFVFLPALPTLLMWGQQLLFVICPTIPAIDAMVIFLVLINICIQGCLVLLLKLILEALPFVDDETRFLSLLIHTVNPASIFFISVYTESLFALFSWLAIYLYFVKRRIWLAASAFLIASFTRSNGSLNAILIIGDILWELFYQPLVMKTPFRLSSVKPTDYLRKIAIVIVIASPSIWWGWFSYNRICAETIAKTLPDYCSDAHFFNIYSLIQSKHWNVGFLKFYQFRQIPNIVLGFPALAITFRYLIRTWQQLQQKPVTNTRIFFPLALHVGANMMVVILFAHVNISTRVLASCSPLFVVAIAHNLLNQHSAWFSFVSLFEAGYVLFGILLHCNNFPWT